jgi:hypothetical protein
MKTKPHIRRLQLKYYPDVYVWGVYISRNSTKPFATARRLETLLKHLGDEHERSRVLKRDSRGTAKRGQDCRFCKAHSHGGPQEDRPLDGHRDHLVRGA